MNRFISILQFLTRIPIRIETGFDKYIEEVLQFYNSKI